ncbi:MAG TPA: exo-alpha-sialidase [Alphaproteobacteria bacterium]|nr:exo-alpha-sialidase [Alphaproteobacteria bacterium]
MPRTAPSAKITFVALILALAPSPAALAEAGATTLEGLSQRTHFHGLAVDPADSSRLLLATHHGLFVVTADGAARQVSSAAEDFMGFSVHPSDGVTLYSSGHPSSGGNLGFRVSTDGGQTWTPISKGATGIADFHSMAVSAADPKTIYGTYAGLQVSRDGGKSWTMVGPGPEGTIDLAASAVDANIVYAGTRIGLMRSTDGGVRWEPAHPSPEAAPLVAVANDGTVYAFVLGTGLIRAREPELAWQAIGRGLGNRVPVHLAIDPKEPARLYAVAIEPGSHATAILASGDGGETWTEFGE